MLQRTVEDIVRLVRAIEEVGPRNLSLVARLVNMPVETVRYIVKVRLPRLGFVFRPVVDEARLGLVKYFLRLSLDEDFRDIAPSILDALARTAYLTYYAALVPQDEYVALASVPVDLEDQYRNLLELLISSNILHSCEVYPLDEVWKISADIKGFNLMNGAEVIEDIEPCKKHARRSIRLKRPDCVEPSVDKIDLLIIKELQKNPLQPFTQMAETLHVREHVLRYHYRAHIVSGGLIPRYMVTWSPREGFLRGDYIGVLLLHRSIDEDVLESVGGILRSIPFSSFEGVCEEQGLYVAILR
ncbi:MAG: hypothetical protein DRJ97_06985, partial [Thermoprotei archaeon]